MVQIVVDVFLRGRNTGKKEVEWSLVDPHAAQSLFNNSLNSFLEGSTNHVIIC
jgi:hypothetical protein